VERGNELTQVAAESIVYSNSTVLTLAQLPESNSSPLRGFLEQTLIGLTT
jgi:hypothetical protein